MRTSYSSTVAKTSREREQEAHEAKLEDLREQVSSGGVVIRTMTAAERAKWAKRRTMLDASSTPAERARRAAALETRRRRSERHL
jgi:hypothetical protein